MLYLEDYLEMIEHLPQELRDRFTELREMDLSVQNNMDSLDKQLRQFFGACRRGEVTGDTRAAQFAEIQKGYVRTEEEAEEKVQLATQMYELVLRYIRKLDTELHKFKCELEADNKGVTEILEKRSLELDAPTMPVQHSTHQANHYRDVSSSRYRVRPEKRRDSWGAPIEARSHTTTSLSRTDSAIQAALGRENYSLGHAGSAIAAAASQAIAATQQMQQGRRTASLKASYEAVSGGGGELAGAAHHALHATHHYGHSVGASASHGSSSHHSTHSHSSNKRHKKKTSSSYASTSGTQALPASRSSSPSQVVGLASTSVLEETVTDSEWTYDPNEPRYCVCNQVSYGDMVACDNTHCPYEWFHYPCVGITAPPKGKWYCPKCSTNMRRNRNRKN